MKLALALALALGGCFASAPCEPAPRECPSAGPLAPECRAARALDALVSERAGELGCGCVPGVVGPLSDGGPCDSSRWPSHLQSIERAGSCAELAGLSIRVCE